MRRLSLPLAAAACLASCVVACGATHASTPRSRVASDLGCTTERTGVRRLDDPVTRRPTGAPSQGLAKWQVTGCGKTAVYVCTTPVRDCWREGEVHAEGAAPTQTASP